MDGERDGERESNDKMKQECKWQVMSANVLRNKLKTKNTQQA